MKEVIMGMKKILNSVRGKKKARHSNTIYHDSSLDQKASAIHLLSF